MVKGGRNDADAGSALERRARTDPELAAGCLAGEPFACCARCYERWVRARLLEHWRGEHFWAELDRGDFGLLRRRIHPNAALVGDVVARLEAGSENLAVITWALATERPFDEVVAILTALDVNTRRLPPFPWLVLTSSCARRDPRDP